MTDFQTIERLARQLADERFGAGHFDRKGTKRAYWRRKARHRLAELAELARACGWRI